MSEQILHLNEYYDRFGIVFWAILAGNASVIATCIFLLVWGFG